MNCTLKVKLNEKECQAVDAACVRETARRGSVQNRSDLLRAWIAAGCPVQPEQCAGPQTAPARGWRKIAPGETIEQGDEFLVREGNAGRWVEARNRVGTQVTPLEDFRRPLHAPPASLVRPADVGGSIGFEVWKSAAADWDTWRPLAGGEICREGDEWYHAESGLWIKTQPISWGLPVSPDGSPIRRLREGVSEKAACVEPPAASVQDAHAGGADAPEKAGMSHKP